MAGGMRRLNRSRGVVLRLGPEVNPLDETGRPVDGTLMPLRFVFVMDPLSSINIEGDSTFVLMLEAQKRGHEVLSAQPPALRLEAGTPWCDVVPTAVVRTKGAHYTLGASTSVCLNDVDAVFMRKDPPIDLNYLTATYLLDRVDRSRVVMINDPQGLRDFNEKLAALYWPEFMPPTMIASSPASLRRFLNTHGTIVVKPLYGSGGAGIVKLTTEDDNFGSVVDLLTQEGRVAIEAQAYLPSVKEGDKRVVLLDGEPIGAVNRRPSKGDIRANMHVGGAAEPSPVTDRDREICAALKPELVRRGLVFAGIDIIGGYLTEVNVTSPTGLQEIGRFEARSLESEIIDWVERRRSAL